MAKKTVRLSCEYWGAPGAGWSAITSFEATPRGYSVSFQTDEDPQPVVVRTVEGSMTWRSMVRDLLELEEVGLGGNLFDCIEVSGASALEADLLRMAWCKFDGPAERQLKLLLPLGDDAVVQLYETLGGLAHEDALLALGIIEEKVTHCGHGPEVVADALKATQLLSEEAPEDWAERVVDWLEAHRPPGPPWSVFEHALTTEELAALTRIRCPSDPEIVALLLERWLAVDPKPSPQGQWCTIHTRTPAIFFKWLVERTLDEGYRTLKARNPERAAQFRQAFLALVERQREHLRSSGGGGAIGAATRAGMRRGWENLRASVLGADAEGVSRS